MKYQVVVAMLMLSAVPLEAQTPAFAPATVVSGRIAGSIEAARELYASARYDEALMVLNGLRPSESTVPAERRAIEQYRSLCLLALGRGTEAETAIAAVVRVDPFYQPSEAEASPRVRATFADVRQRLLPDLAGLRYTAAKQAYDQKAFADAAVRFKELVALLDDPQMNGRLSDMRTLAAGFVEIARAAAAPPPPAPVKPEPAAPALPPAPKPAAPVEARVYTAEDPGVIAPAVIRQEVPPVPTAVLGMTKDSAVLDLVIDEKGRVISLALRQRLHPLYDATILTAARDWKYQPAKLNGVPVRYRKLLQITVKR